MRLTLRTLLAYIDDTLPAEDARVIGLKVAESETAREMIDRIRKVTRRRGLSTPSAADGTTDPNVVSEYLSDALPQVQMSEFEITCLDSDAHLAEVAACHQILTLLLTDPVRVPPTARQRMYRLVTGPESLPDRKPGATIPVGGVSTEAPQPGTAEHDADATYLLGFSAYSRQESFQTRAKKLMLLAGLLMTLCAAVWMAWAATVPAESGVKQPEPVAVAPPTVVAAIPAKPLEAAPQPKLHAETPVAVPTTPRVVEAPAAPPAAKVAAPPRTERVTAGKLETPASVVLVRRGTEKPSRVMPAEPQLFTTDEYTCLPGYKATFQLPKGIKLDLWGHLPEAGTRDVLESSVVLYVPDEAAAADVNLSAGRIYLSTSTPAGGVIRLRIAAQVWDVAVKDDKTLVAVEMTQPLERGFAIEPRPGATPVEVQLHVLAGSASVTVASTGVAVGANHTLVWKSGITLPRVTTASEAPHIAESLHFAVQPPIINEQTAKECQKALAEFATQMTDPNSIRVKIAEMLVEKPEYPPAAQHRCRLAVFLQAATNDLPGLVDALSDPARAFNRDAAISGLIEVLPRLPDGATKFRDLLTKKGDLTPEQATTAVRLIRMLNYEERTNVLALDSLVDLLNSPVLVIRELALWNLKTGVITDYRANPVLARLDVGAAADVRESGVKAWKRRVEEFKKTLEAAPKKT